MFDKRDKAIFLRQKGFSLSEISRQLKVSKSTASIWCKHIHVLGRALQRLKKHTELKRRENSLKGANVNHRKKIDSIESYMKLGKETIVNLEEREFLIAGLGLYWGEGSKSGKLAFINSDPSMVKFMYIWFQRVLNVEKSDMMPRIFINQIHESRIGKVQKFWSKLLDLPVQQFGNPTFLKIAQKKKYTNHENYYGMLSLRVRRGTNLRYKILGLIEGLKNAI